jgi:hypothetical protein
MYSNSPVRRQQGVQETVYDREVALAAQAQGNAPAAAAPPLLVKALEPIKNSILVGAPVPDDHHARAPAPQVEARKFPEADAFATAEIARRVKAGGFYDTGANGMQQIAAIKGEPFAYLGSDKWSLYAPQVPPGLRPIMQEPGLQFGNNSARQMNPPPAANSKTIAEVQAQMANSNSVGKSFASNGNKSSVAPPVSIANASLVQARMTAPGAPISNVANSAQAPNGSLAQRSAAMSSASSSKSLGANGMGGNGRMNVASSNSSSTGLVAAPRLATPLGAPTVVPSSMNGALPPKIVSNSGANGKSSASNVRVKA